MYDWLADDIDLLMEAQAVVARSNTSAGFCARADAHNVKKVENIQNDSRYILVRSTDFSIPEDCKIVPDHGEEATHNDGGNYVLYKKASEKINAT